MEPGCLLELNVGFVQKRARVCKFWGKASVEGKVTCDVQFTAMVERGISLARTLFATHYHELTDLAGMRDFRKFDQGFAATNRLRTEGTDHLLEGIRRLPVRRIVAQSYAGPGFFARTGGPIKTEEDPFDPDPPAALRRTVEAVRYLERAVLEAEGIQGTVLRYGGFYGAADDGLIGPVRKRQFPLVGGGTGYLSWVHLGDAASAAVLAVEQEARGVFNIVDDEPAQVREWLPYLAESAGARRPMRLPKWVAQLLAGEMVKMVTEGRAFSNAKAKRELGWELRYPSWRQGFKEELA